MVLALLGATMVCVAEPLSESRTPMEVATELSPAVRISMPPDCAPYQVEPGAAVSTPEQTKEVALAYFAAGKRHDVEEMDAVMAEDATIWYAGSGCFDRTQWGPMHYANPHPPSEYIGVEMPSLIVEGDRAVMEMLTEQAWPGGGYLKFHSIHMWVSNGKIVSLRQYSVDAKPAANGSPE